MNFNFSHYEAQIWLTVIAFVIFWLLRFITHRLIKRFASLSKKTERRSNLIKKYVDIFLSTLLIIFIPLVWGVDSKSIFGYLTALTAFIGVALFAQWSILSNVTAGVVMFFSFPYKIGDKIRIQDKDFPIEARIEDIRAFHTMLLTTDGEYISYPNSLFLQKSVVILDQEE
ncbi:mechanosensitive ion channel domain-containing protein [Avrilella dinanensis]|uniref:mechanosensitive ion channel domain-containing protein n=1 Tax=Avrilella dinanensis TaxID=2008672 RepID=UPI00240A8466|nr:mechanosensitive ion channel family protein [Avrilella dinanensis]